MADMLPSHAPRRVDQLRSALQAAQAAGHAEDVSALQSALHEESLHEALRMAELAGNHEDAAHLRLALEGAPGGAETFARHFAQGMTADSADELAAAAQNAPRAAQLASQGLNESGRIFMQGNQRLSPKALAQAYPGMPYPEAVAAYHREHPEWQTQSAAPLETAREQTGGHYRDLRNAIRVRDEAGAEAHPWAARTGNMGGVVATSMAMGGLNELAGHAAEGSLPYLGRLGEAAKSGAKWGTAFGIGDAPEARDIPEHAALSAAAGLVAAPAVETGVTLARPVARKVGSALEDYAARRAIEATGAPRAAINRIPEAEAVGRAMLREPGLSLRNAEAIQTGSSAARAGYGQQMGELARGADSTGLTSDTGELVSKVMGRNRVAGLGKNTETRPLQARIQAFMEDQAAQHPQMTPSQLHDLRMQLDPLSRWNMQSPQQLTQGFRAARGTVKADLQNLMEQAGVGREWEAANQGYSLMERANQLASKGVQQQQGWRPLLQRVKELPDKLVPGPAIKARTADVVGRGLQRFGEADLPATRLLNQQQLDELVKQGQANGGFTVDPVRNTTPKSGLAYSARPDFERTYSQLTPETVQEYAQSHAGLFRSDPYSKLGGWYDPESGKWYLDVSRVVHDKGQAMAGALRSHQKAIYDIGTGETLPTIGPAERPVPTSTLGKLAAGARQKVPELGREFTETAAHDSADEQLRALREGANHAAEMTLDEQLRALRARAAVSADLLRRQPQQPQLQTPQLQSYPEVPDVP